MLLHLLSRPQQQFPLKLNHRHKNTHCRSDLQSCNTNSSLHPSCCSRQHRRRYQRPDHKGGCQEGKLEMVLSRRKKQQNLIQPSTRCPTSPINVLAAFQSCGCSPATGMWAPTTTDFPLDSQSVDSPMCLYIN